MGGQRLRMACGDVCGQHKGFGNAAQCVCSCTLSGLWCPSGCISVNNQDITLAPPPPHLFLQLQKRWDQQKVATSRPNQPSPPASLFAGNHIPHEAESQNIDFTFTSWTAETEIYILCVCVCVCIYKYIQH